jgi:hypothetical protein
LTSVAQTGNLPAMALTDRDRAILDFERTWWLEPGSKTAAIRDRLRLSPARYYEVLGSLATSPEAHTYDPLLVRRLRRLQARRRRARLEGRPAVHPPGR